MLDIDAARERLAQGRKCGGVDVPMMDYLDVSLTELAQARAAVVKLAGELERARLCLLGCYGINEVNEDDRKATMRSINRAALSDPAVAAIVGGGG